MKLNEVLKLLQEAGCEVQYVNRSKTCKKIYEVSFDFEETEENCSCSCKHDTGNNEYSHDVRCTNILAS